MRGPPRAAFPRGASPARQPRSQLLFFFVRGGVRSPVRRVFEKLGARVVVDSASLELLSGATIDFEEEMMRQAFVVAENPQSSAGCGCGSSFQAKDF